MIRWINRLFVTAALALINCINVKWAIQAQNVFTFLKVIALLFIIISGIGSYVLGTASSLSPDHHDIDSCSQTICSTSQWSASWFPWLALQRWPPCPKSVILAIRCPSIRDCSRLVAGNWFHLFFIESLGPHPCMKRVHKQFLIVANLASLR